MKIPEGFFVIHQPKYTVPCVFDLNDRGTFSTRPAVTGSWGYRILADADSNARIQLARLMKRPGKDSQSGKSHDWVVEEVLLELDDLLTPDPEAVARKVADAKVRSALMEEFNAWHDNFIPMNKETVDREELRQKLIGVVKECKDRFRRELVRKNQQWVLSNIPRRVHDFKFGLYNHVKERLYLEYQNNGGEDSEQNLIKKIALFNRVLENCGRENLLKPNGNSWGNEDEIWQCWIGYAGSESEAQRVCRTMDAVFKDLQLIELDVS